MRQIAFTLKFEFVNHVCLSALELNQILKFFYKVELFSSESKLPFMDIYIYMLIKWIESSSTQISK